MGAGEAVVTRWWLIRHAPVKAPPGTIAGQLDLPPDLSDDAALSALAARLPRGAAWVTTPLKRTMLTMGRLRGADPSGMPAFEPDLLEQHFGAWQGRTHADLADDPAAAAFWTAPDRAVPPGGESFAGVVDRTAGALNRLGRAHAGRDIVMVGHAGPIRATIGLALGLTPEKMLALCVDCLHLTRLDHIGPGRGSWRLVAANIPPR